MAEQEQGVAILQSRSGGSFLNGLPVPRNTKHAETIVATEIGLLHGATRIPRVWGEQCFDGNQVQTAERFLTDLDFLHELEIGEFQEAAYRGHGALHDQCVTRMQFHPAIGRIRSPSRMTPTMVTSCRLAQSSWSSVNPTVVDCGVTITSVRYSLPSSCSSDCTSGFGRNLRPTRKKYVAQPTKTVAATGVKSKNPTPWPVRWRKNSLTMMLLRVPISVH